MTHTQFTADQQQRAAAEMTIDERSEADWYSVETPSVFCEYQFPACRANWSRADKRKFQRLKTLAENHGTHINRCGYSRG